MAKMALLKLDRAYNLCRMEKRFMTAREFAAAINKPYPTVALWLRQNRVPGAYQERVGDFGVWQIPVEAVKQFEPPKQGRPKKATTETKPAAKKRTNRKAEN
jgi:hypothetical protein